MVGIDTCVYVSGGEPFIIGHRSIWWDGKDKVGRQMVPGNYTYYLLAVDEFNDPKPVGIHLWDGPHGSIFTQYTLDDGTILERPRVWKGFSYVELGQDTDSAVRVEFMPPEGIEPHPTIAIDPDDNNIIYFQAGDPKREQVYIAKAILNPDSPAEIVTDFGDEGFFYFPNEFWNSTGLGGPGVSYQNGMLATSSFTWDGIYSNVFLIDAATGEEVRTIDLSDWYVDEEQEGQKCGGPTQVRFSRFTQGLIHTVSHGSCMRLAFNVLNGGDHLLWANGNGDYYCDKNYPGCHRWDPDRAWICHDDKPGEFNHGIECDEHNFVYYNSNWGGIHRATILGPDGYGICKVLTLINIYIPSEYIILVGNDTAYDGLFFQFIVSNPDLTIDECIWQGYDIFKGSIAGVIGVEVEMPIDYTLSNFPDPFNPATTISYSISKAGHVTIEVFNVMGQKVARLFDGYKDAGSYYVKWDASEFAGGVYFAVMKTKGFTKTEKMMLVK